MTRILLALLSLTLMTSALHAEEARVIAPLPFKIAKAQYRVPVADPNLAPFAVTTLESLNWEVVGGERVLAYRISEELTGRTDSAIFLAGPEPGEEGEVRLKGQGGRAVCSDLDSWGEITCYIAYRNLQFDAAAREALLTERYRGRPEEMNARIMVGRHFEADPIGFLTFSPY